MHFVPLYLPVTFPKYRPFRFKDTYLIPSSSQPSMMLFHFPQHFYHSWHSLLMQSFAALNGTPTNLANTFWSPLPFISFNIWSQISSFFLNLPHCLLFSFDLYLNVISKCFTFLKLMILKFKSKQTLQNSLL